MGKTILITGASGDIGIGLVKIALESDSIENVVLQYNKNKPDINTFKTDKNILCIGADLKDEKQVLDMFLKIHEKFSCVDILVNNAGISQIKLFDTIDICEWDNMLNTNLRSAFLCSKMAAKDMIKNKDGVIINISSIWGQIGASCEVHYSASKGGMIAMTKALAKELAPSNIRVNSISPGAIQGKMNAHLSDEEKQVLCDEIPLGRFGEPKEVARLARFLWEEGTYITGQDIGINGGN